MKPSAKIIIAIAIFLAGFYAGQSKIFGPSSLTNKPAEVNQVDSPVKERIKVNLMVDFGNGEIKTFNEVTVKVGATVFDLLKELADQEKIRLIYKKDFGEELGAFIDSIDNFSSNGRKNLYWQYWVNNIYAQVGASNYQLKDGDVVEWKYIKTQFK